MAQGLSHPQRYRGFILTSIGLQKLHDCLKKLEIQTRLRQSPRSIAERIQLSAPEGIHSITVRKILSGQNGVDKRSIQLVFQVLQLQLEEGDYAHAGLCRKSVELHPETPVQLTSLPGNQDCEPLGEFNFWGRVDELNGLRQAIISNRCRFVQILGMAGVGKTTLASMLTKIVQPEFDLVIWKPLRHAPSIQAVLTSILQSLIRHTEKNIELPTSVEALTELLIEQLQTHRCLIVLDHFNAVLSDRQYAGYYHQKHEDYCEFLQVISEVPHQSCLILTSREKPKAIGIAEHYSQSLQLSGLSASEYQPIFSSFNEFDGTLDSWQSLVELYEGNPLVLTTLKAHIQNYFNNSISNYLKYLQHGKVLFSDLRDLLKQQFDRLSSVEQELVFHLAQYQVPVSVLQFREDIGSSISAQSCLEGLESLERRSLLHRQGACVMLSSLMKRYADECLVSQHAELSTEPKLEIMLDQEIADYGDREVADISFLLTQ